MRIALIVPVLALVLSGCISIYRMDVPQGNIVGPEMIEKVKPGMTRAQVRFVLGTPLISDPFHADRWDYVYLDRKSPGATRRLTAIFSGDALLRLEGDVVPAPSPPGASTAPATAASSRTD